MKKFLVVLAVFALLASSAFSATTVTKEYSQSNYPGVLTLGSVSGTSTFVSDLGLLSNSAMLESIMGGVYALVALNTDIGTIAVSASPDPSISLSGIGVTTPSNVLGLSWATKGDMKIGASLLYGLNSQGWENKEPVTNAQNPDKTSSYNQYIGLKGGIGMKNGLDLALGLALANNGSFSKDLDNVTKANEGETEVSNMKFGVDASGRLDLGNGLRTVASAEFVMGSEVTKSWTDPGNDGTKDTNSVVTETNSRYGVSALIGKDIKANESLTVKIASGVSFDGTIDSVTLTENKVANTKAYTPNVINSDVDVSIPFNVAIEGKLNETWGINFGTSMTILSTNMGAEKSKTDVTSNSYKDRETDGSLSIDPGINFAIGTTGKIGDLTLDLYLNSDILANGPYFISGLTTGPVINYGVAICYNWK